VIIKAAKRIFNSEKICCSYYDFYFGVTFLEHTVCVSLCSYQQLYEMLMIVRDCGAKYGTIFPGQ